MHWTAYVLYILLGVCALKTKKMGFIIYVALVPIWLPMAIIGLAYKIAKKLVNGISDDLGYS